MSITPVTLRGAALAVLLSLAGLSQQALASPRANTAQQPGILVLGPDDFTRTWVQLLTQGFRDVVLAGPQAPVVYLESLDAARFEDADYLDDLRAWLGRKYRDRRIDLVVSLGEEGVAFLAKKRGEPWPGVPVLYADVGGISVDTRTSLPQARGLILEDHFPAALAVIKHLLPGTKQVALIYGASALEQARVAGFADKVRQANLGLTPIEFAGLSIDQMQSRVAALPDDAVVFILFPSTDATGRVLSPNEACERLSAAASRPAFMMGRQDVGCGVVGGLVRDMNVFGRLIGEQAVARLHGRATETVTLPIARYTSLVFDARQLERWAIPETRLPAGSTVLFRQPNVWRDYRAQLVAVCAVVVLQAVLIGGLVLEHARRRRAEGQARHHLVAMAHLDRRHALGELTASLAHELSQPLSAILRNAEAAKMMLAGGAPISSELLEIVEDIRKDDKRAGEVIRRLRALLCQHELETEPVDINSIASEAAAIVAPDAVFRGVRLDLDLPGKPSIVGGDRVHLQQVLLNLMLNGMEAMAPLSAERRRLTVGASCHNGSVAVSVADTGPGLPGDAVTRIFEPFYTTKGNGMGMGLSIARSIIEAHGGHIEAENNVTGGATVRFSLPLQRS